LFPLTDDAFTRVALAGELKLNTRADPSIISSDPITDKWISTAVAVFFTGKPAGEWPLSIVIEEAI
jgi:hypothetical protein